MQSQFLEYYYSIEEYINKNESEPMANLHIKLVDLIKQHSQEQFIYAVLADSVCIKKFGASWLSHLIEESLFNSSCGGQKLLDHIKQLEQQHNFHQTKQYSLALLLYDHKNFQSNAFVQKFIQALPIVENPQAKSFYIKSNTVWRNWWILILPTGFVICYLIEIAMVIYYGHKLEWLNITNKFI